MNQNEIIEEVQHRSMLSLGRRDFLKAAAGTVPLVLTGDMWRPRRAFAQEIQYGGTLKCAVAGSPLTFDPNFFELFEEIQTGSMIYNRLVHLEPDMSAQPELALSWEANEDSSVWTFKLRQGVKFHNGRELTAEDVAHFFNRVADPASGSMIISELSPLAGAEVVDKYTVRILLSSGYADWIIVAGKPRASIIARESEGKDTRAPIGTGPYKFKQFVPGERIVVEANRDYWQEGQPYFDEAQLLIFPDPAAATSALIAGDIDYRWEIEQEYIEVLSGEPDIAVERVPGTGYQDLIMDMREKPFDDVRVREAIKYSCDREKFVQAVTDGFGVPANDQPISPMNPFYANIPIRKQDYKKATELLTAAGYPNGLDLDLHTSEIRAGMVPSAITLKDQLAPAGIRVNVKVEPADGYWKEIWRKKPFHYSNWGGRPLVHDSLFPYFSSEGKWNESHYVNPTVDQMMLAAMSEPNVRQRQAYYSACQALVMHEAGIGIPYFRDYIMAHRKDIAGVHLFSVKWNFYNRLYRVKA